MSGYAQERHNAHGALKYMLMVSYRDLEDELWPLSCLYLRPAEE